MTILFAAFGLMLVFEGLLYGSFPSLAKRMAEMLEQTPEDTIRIVGLGAALVGLFILWLTVA